MRRYRMTDLADAAPDSHFLAGLVAGKRLYKGEVSFHKPGTVTHDAERPHVEVDQEVFLLLQGEGWIEIDGRREAVAAGDVLVIEPGEDHHLHSSHENPLVNLWLHAE
ncbi:cupin domain-containing protein [bacterium]|nr:MAG: cupin domain-containing protein [bacterium]